MSSPSSDRISLQSIVIDPPPKNADDTRKTVDRLFYSNGGWESEQLRSPERIAETVTNRQPGIEVIFLPAVNSDEVQAMKNNISSVFGVPEFFWTNTGHKANGFFNNNGSPMSDRLSNGTMSRFLIKEIQYTPGSRDYDYKWQYISFVTLWYSENYKNANPTQILLCFDVSTEIEELIRGAFKKSTPANWSHCPLGLYSVVIPVITDRFDESLWKFKEPVREIENERNHSMDQDAPANALRERYIQMHELSRHVIHEVETLGISGRTVALISQHHERCKRDSCSTETNGSLGFSFHERFLENLRDRASAFEKRLQSEITLAYNLVAAEDQRDGKQLTRLVSTATLLFLPGSFVSSFFGMNFFDYGDKAISTSDQIYIFVVSTVVLTAIGFIVWKLYGHDRRRAANTAPIAPRPPGRLTGF